MSAGDDAATKGCATATDLSSSTRPSPFPAQHAVIYFHVSLSLSLSLSLECLERFLLATRSGRPIDTPPLGPFLFLILFYFLAFHRFGLFFSFASSSSSSSFAPAA